MAKLSLVGNLIRESEAKALMRLGYSVVKMPPSSVLPHPMATHTDMLVFIGFGCLFTHKSYYEENSALIEKIANDCKLEIIISDEELGKSYPSDVLFNAALVGNKLICNPKHISRHILDKAKNNGCELICVKQGYTKCSVCALGDNAIITADKGIHIASLAHGVDSLLIDAGHISLPPYEYGFIGGASGACDDEVYFCGDINSHPSGRKILEFAKKHEKNVTSLSEGELLDIGSILFV